MVQEGAFVYITGRDQDKLDRAAAAALGERARALQADVTVRADMQVVIERIRADHGRLDILFANAGAA